MTKRKIKRQEKDAEPTGYRGVLEDIRSILERAKAHAYRMVDNIRVQAYWQVGERIVRAELEHKERADYGARVIEKLSVDLGFQRRRVFEIVQLFRCYPIVHALHAQLSWYHYVVLIRVAEKEKRRFYEAQAVQNGWSYRELERQIKAELYERTLKDGQLVRPVAQVLQPLEPANVFKDIYNFDFLGLTSNHSEEQLKQALLAHVEDVLSELGSEFFIGRREVPVLVGGNYDRVDLELFHAGLLCYILVEIKTEPFRHSHVSQMYSYLNWYKEYRLREGQRSPIGLIICKTKDNETVHYALGDLKKEIFIAEYRTSLPSEDEILQKIK